MDRCGRCFGRSLTRVSKSVPGGRTDVQLLILYGTAPSRRAPLRASKQQARKIKSPKMDEDGKEKQQVVLMWGYLPGVSPQRSALFHPVAVPMPEHSAGDSWRDVCGGGCGFATAISKSGKLLTWGSTEDMGQSYLTAGKHEEIPEAFPLPAEVDIVKAAAGWAHCVAATVYGEVYTWGWKECVPSGRVFRDHPIAGSLAKNDEQNGLLNDQVSPSSIVSRTSSKASGRDSRAGDGTKKRKKVSSTKQDHASSTSGDDSFSAVPCLVPLSAGVRITAVAAGGRHTLALSDAGQVWGWGYGREGQLGLGSRIHVVSSPQPIPCVGSTTHARDWIRAAAKGSKLSDGEVYKVTGSCVKAIACGGRHSAVITDTGAVLTFGWGQYGQCGRGCTDDELTPMCVSSLLGVKMQGIAAGLWHTICTSADGDVYAFGGNQFGQLGTGSDQAEFYPKLLDAPCLENMNAKVVSCGARHSAIITDVFSLSLSFFACGLEYMILYGYPFLYTSLMPLSSIRTARDWIVGLPIPFLLTRAGECSGSATSL